MSDLNFDSLFGDANMEIDCPNCHTKISFKLKDAGTVITCPNCSVKINLKKDDNFYKNKQSADDSLKDFKNTLENFGK